MSKGETGRIDALTEQFKTTETLEDEVRRLFREHDCTFLKDVFEADVYLVSTEYHNAPQCEYPQIKCVLDKDLVLMQRMNKKREWEKSRGIKLQPQRRPK